MEKHKSDIIIYTTADGVTKIETHIENDTVWLTQEQMAELFQKDRTVIGRHIRNIFVEGELDPKVVCAYFAHTTQHGAMVGKTHASNRKSLERVSQISRKNAITRRRSLSRNN